MEEGEERWCNGRGRVVSTRSLGVKLRKVSL
jgi:hypothetical protein